MLSVVLALVTAGWAPPIEVKKLPNGLTVVVSEDHSSPTFGLCVSYRIGHRLEPRGRSGFAHLFEHMMFEGTPTSKKGTMDRIIEGGGGSFNATTRADETTYESTAPISALDQILWLEADRMRALDFSTKNLANQKDVVKEEIRVNVTNRPYGEFFSTDLYGLAFDRWETTHDGYGSFADLDAAHVGDVKEFYRRYYGPGNAVLAVVGDVKPAELFARVEKYFGALPARAAPERPDLAEGLGKAPRQLVQSDPFAKVGALAVGWRMPPRGSADQLPMAVLAALLADGEASRLYLGLVRGKKLLSRLEGGIGWPDGDAFDYDGPTLFTLHGLYKHEAAEVVTAIDGEIARVVRSGVSAEELKRVKARLRADFYTSLEPFLERATELAMAQAVWGDLHEFLALPERLDAVTPADVQRVAATYLVPTNRAVIERRPAVTK
jgi:zinc protease